MFGLFGRNKEEERNWSLKLSTSGLNNHGLSGNHTCMLWVDNFWVIKMRLGKVVLLMTFA
jgi:hypothetical protein